MKYLFSFLLILSFLLSSCAQERGEHEALFRQVEAVVAERPDSALALLRTVGMPWTLPEDERARYNELYGLAWWNSAVKNYSDHDSLFNNFSGLNQLDSIFGPAQSGQGSESLSRLEGLRPGWSWSEEKSMVEEPKWTTPLLIVSGLINLLMFLLVGWLIYERKKRKREECPPRENPNPENTLQERLEEDVETSREKVCQHENHEARTAFANSPLYDRFQKKIAWEPSPDDWAELFRSVDSGYPQFASALDRDLPGLTIQERRLCYLIKINVKPSRVAQLLNMADNNVSMWRKRLFTKATGQAGGSKDFDSYILNI